MIKVVQLISHVWLFVNPWTIAHQASLSFSISQTLLKLMSIESVMPSNHLILCHPLLLLPLIFLSIRVFSKESALRIRRPKYWSFSFSISPSNVYSGLISFRIDWFDLAIQGTLKRLLQHHSSKALILQRNLLYGPTFISVHGYWENHRFDCTDLCSKVMFLLLYILSRFVIAFLSRNKRLFISWLQSPSTVILEPKKIKSVTVSTFPPSICHEVMRPDAMILVFWMFSFKPAFYSSLSPSSRHSSSSSLSTIRVVSSAYLRLLIFLPAILIPACASSSLAFHMMYYA